MNKMKRKKTNRMSLLNKIKMMMKTTLVEMGKTKKVKTENIVSKMKLKKSKKSLSPNSSNIYLSQRMITR